MDLFPFPLRTALSIGKTIESHFLDDDDSALKKDLFFFSFDSFQWLYAYEVTIFRFEIRFQLSSIKILVHLLSPRPKKISKLIMDTSVLTYLVWYKQVKNLDWPRDLSCLRKFQKYSSCFKKTISGYHKFFQVYSSCLYF